MRKLFTILFLVLIVIGPLATFARIAHAAPSPDIYGFCPSNSTGPGGKPPCTCNSGFKEFLEGTGKVACVTAEQEQQINDNLNKVQAVIDPIGQGIAIALKGFVGVVGSLTLRLGALVLALSGLLFDAVIKYTIVDMAKNLSTDNGIGNSINAAWSTIRDLANMVFIFVLLWAAIQTILDIGGDLGKTIKNIVLVGLLINFSLFFTRVVIDASNIAAIGFLQSIKSSAGTEITIPPFGSIGSYSSIVMRHTGLQSFWGGQSLETIIDSDNDGSFLMGILGTVLVLVLAVILFVASVLFISRYIILIFLMILSPLALIGYALPALSGKSKDWWTALINQAFFAPLFFVLLWIAIKMMSATYPGTPSGIEFAVIAKNPGGAIQLILNYTLVLGLFIAALIFSKQMAMKTQGFGKLTSFIGGVAVGGAAITARNTIGRVSNAAFQSETLRNMASDKNRSWIGRKFAQSTLNVSKRGAEGSYDVRGLGETKLGKMAGGKELFSGLGDTTGKGGFAKAVEEKAKAKEKYAKETYDATSAEKERLSRAQDAEKDNIRATRQINLATAQRESNAANTAREHHLNTQESVINAKLAYEATKRDVARAKEEVGNARGRGDTAAVEMLEKRLEAMNARMTNERELLKEAKEEIMQTEEYQTLKRTADEKAANLQKAQKQVGKKDFDDEEYSQRVQNMKKAPQKRQEAYAERLEGLPFGFTQGNQEAARKVRAQAKGKSAKDKLAEAAQQLQREEGSGEQTPPATPAGGEQQAA